WNTGLLDCCSDCGLCIYGAFCFPCLGCQVAGEMDECCLCGPSVAMRTLYRTRYNIPGSILDDWAATTFCSTCALCQLKRDINWRREQGIF
ncbi:PLAC8 protein, partial [Rostratula benghalensis]|nr:PLAC8 protein [Rostratula benghalensis]